jgi:hypothetical protein
VRRIRTIGLCLVAVLAASALATATASAAEGPPQFEKCVKAAKVGKTYVGKYTSKECTAASEVETGGKYEREEAESMPFTSKAKAVTITAAGKVVKCKKAVDAGEILSGEAETVAITFEKCGVNGSTKEPCTTTGQASGTIKTTNLVGTLHWINPAETEVGILLFKAGGTNTFTTFTCKEESIELRSVLVGSVTNTKKGMTFTFKTSGGKQEKRAYWEEGEEQTGFGETIPFHLYTNPGKVEATVEFTDEQGPKGVSAF